MHAKIAKPLVQGNAFAAFAPASRPLRGIGMSLISRQARKGMHAKLAKHLVQRYAFAPFAPP